LRKTNPQVHGVIVGDTHPKKCAYLDELKQLVQQLNLANDVTFVGHRSDLREVLAVSQLVFSLSTSPESFGLTTLEALALGRPVIGYDHGGVGELLRELFPAGRVPLRDEATLLSITQELLAVHPAPKPVQEPFTLDALFRDTLDIYKALGAPDNQRALPGA
jgi:glycosyltransferase involved in cell wall biosynthesis